MKRANHILLVAVLLFSAIISFSACKTDIPSSIEKEILTGIITGKAFYPNAVESSGIIITLEKTDGLKSLGVVNSIDLGCFDSRVRSIVGNSKTDTEGNYAFTDIEEGIYTIYASSKDSTEKAVTTNVVVRRNESVTAEDLILTATGNINGKITLNNSETESLGFLISIAGTSYMATTDIDGSFTISNVPAKEGYHIIVTKQMLTYMFEEAITVTAKETIIIPSKNFTTSEITAGYKDGEDGISIKWLGAFASEEKIENPKYLDAYFNTTDECSYIYDGTKWDLLAKGIHSHTYSDEWAFDENAHWYQATCGHSVEKDYSAHKFEDGGIFQAATEISNAIGERYCTVCKFSELYEYPNTQLHEHIYNSNFVCEYCGTVAELTVSEFLHAIEDSVITITADKLIPGITKSEDGTTVNLYGVKISGKFSSMDHFPSSLENVDLSGLDVSKITDMGYMFFGCNTLETLNLGTWDTRKVTNMSHMFEGCSSFKGCDFSFFPLLNVTDMSYMFAGCESLEGVGFTNINTSKVSNMSHMFENCIKLFGVNLNDLNTSKVTDMSFMFNNCRILHTLDISNFDTTYLSDMSYMFANCNQLNTIYVSEKFKTNASGYHMFDECFCLVGAIRYDSSKTDRIYANYKTGYFTLKQ